MSKKKPLPYYQLICPMCGPNYSELKDGIWQCCHREITENNRIHKEKHEEFIRMENAWREKLKAYQGVDWY